MDINKLPASLKERYEAMGLLPQKQIKVKEYHVDLEQMKKNKIEKEKSIEEKLQEVQISSTESKALDRYSTITNYMKSLSIDHWWEW